MSSSSAQRHICVAAFEPRSGSGSRQATLVHRVKVALGGLDRISWVLPHL